MRNAVNRIHDSLPYLLLVMAVLILAWLIDLFGLRTRSYQFPIPYTTSDVYSNQPGYAEAMSTINIEAEQVCPVADGRAICPPTEGLWRK
jgi:hypothetical protein